jgi:hypothetical protein
MGEENGTGLTPVRPGRNGGALRSGNPGNAGRPRSLIRDAAAAAFEERIPLLCRIIDGAPLERSFQADGAEKPIIVRASADVGERLAAMRELRAVGLPTSRDVTVESVRERLVETLRIIRSKLPQGEADELIQRIEGAWK